MRTLTIDCRKPLSTAVIGQLIGEKLFPGAVIALNGPLGAGKTFLTRSIAEGLNVVNPVAITSPTFMLIQEYDARLPIYHFDAYRLKSIQQFEDLGALDYFAGEGVCLVEWAERIEPLLPKEHLEIRLEPNGEESRLLTLTAHGEKYEALLTSLSH